MSQLDDNVGNFLKQTLVSYHVFFGKPRDILPCVVWKVTRRIMKTVFGIRSFKKNLDSTVRQNIGMYNLRPVIQR